jgi:beta-glucosidase
MQKPSPQEIEKKIEALLASMTMEEKIGLCHAGSKFGVNALERLGIPEFKMSDGPHGVRHEFCRDSWEPLDTDEDRATYLPTGTALASTWSVPLARRFGEVLGAEARQRGKDVILGPGINIIRTPICGRNFEYYGEDPCHIRKMVVPAIQGIQSNQVAACVKHFAANSQEQSRQQVDAQMDERTLREIYLPGFKAAVEEGGSLTVMGAYNRFRGQYCCHNEHLVNDILKGEWAFDGSYISDWNGATDTREAEMGTDRPYDQYFLAKPFADAIASGELEVGLLDDKVRRNLRVMFRIGMFDPERSQGERNTARHHQAALEIAQEAMVLLKNENATLPLDPRSLSRLVVIGTNATAKHAPGGHSSGVKALYEIAPLEGLRNRLGTAVEIRYFTGYPVNGEGFKPMESDHLGIGDEGAGTHGWKATYWKNRDKKGEPVHKAEVLVDSDWSTNPPLKDVEPASTAALLEATLVAPQSGIYQFILTGAQHAFFIVDDEALIHRFDGGDETVVKSMHLEAGRTYRLKIDVKPADGNVRLKLGWIPPWSCASEENTDEMFDAVRQADAVLFFGGLNHQYDLEGADRADMALHEGQNELIAKISALNPRSAVVLVAGSPVEMPWADKVPAIVQMGYAGMEGGNAIADVLLGNINPSGKLPMTFPKSLKDSPAHALDDYHPNVCHYKEGIFVGYRWFDAHDIEPLFPFGHGLSYTRFVLSDLRVKTDASGTSVSLTVENAGARAGAEVVQIYIGQLECSVPRPKRELKGFAKVFLQPGTAQRVEIALSPEDFAYWSPSQNEWVAEPGKFRIEAGVSSRDIRLKEVIEWRKA